jgi:hypothetical protein
MPSDDPLRHDFHAGLILHVGDDAEEVAQRLASHFRENRPFVADDVCVELHLKVYADSAFAAAATALGKLQLALKAEGLLEPELLSVDVQANFVGVEYRPVWWPPE